MTGKLQKLITRDISALFAYNAKGNLSFLCYSPSKWSRAADHKFFGMLPVVAANVVINIARLLNESS